MVFKFIAWVEDADNGEHDIGAILDAKPRCLLGILVLKPKENI